MLSVRGLLLADAIQSFGPDFKLLIASHGQPVRQSAPERTLPVLIRFALHKHGVPTTNQPIVEVIFVNSDKIGDNLQVANIQFNNINIIGKDFVLLVDLTFTFMFQLTRNNRRTDGIRQTDDPQSPTKTARTNRINSQAGRYRRINRITRVNRRSRPSPPGRTHQPGSPKITFDFHRLNVLILARWYVHHARS